MMTLVSKWFEPVSVPHQYDWASRAVLLVILTIGTWLRFWGLGNVGLHGDEETTVMPALALLDQGLPVFPSGMLYARAPLHTCLIAASAWLFGPSEWAFRFPSAVVGSLTGLVAFFMGRRFLPPAYNLAFVAAITFLPVMIEISQTARMYVFWVTCLIAFVACIFRWERDQRLSSLCLALVFWIVALQFQTLSVLLAPLFLFPGLSRRSIGQFSQGLATAVIAGLLFDRFNIWAGSFYPTYSERPAAIASEQTATGLEVLTSGHAWLLAAAFMGIFALVFILLGRIRRFSGRWHAGPVLLIGCAILGVMGSHLYVGTLVLLIGVVFWLRSPDLPRSWLVGLVVLCGAFAALNLWLLHASGIESLRKLIGALLGQPSVWPVIRMLEYSPGSAVVFGAAILPCVVAFANGGRLPMHFLFLGLAVIAPLFLLGFYYVQSRYMLGQLPSFLLCVFAALHFAAQRMERVRQTALPRSSLVIALLFVTVVVVNPVALARTVYPTYGLYPDHKGAAEYIKSVRPGSNAMVVAEDVLQQTYYLGHVAFWLRQADDAQKFSIVRGGQAVDQYTATPVLGTGAQLEALLDSSAGRDVYVVGSGENFTGSIRAFRGRGIQEVLDSGRLQVVYAGRDGRTKVWKLAH